MKQDQPKSKRPKEWRRQAEERLRDKQAETIGPMTEENLRALVHELQVHQIELEMQNGELKHAGLEIEYLLNKYSDLYDFAPVGYVTLDEEGLILEANLTGAALLGAERRNLIKKPIRRFIAEASHAVFDDFQQALIERRTKQACEVNLLKEGNLSFHALIEGISPENRQGRGEQCQLAIIDITDRKNAEEALRRAHDELEQRVRERTAELSAANRQLQDEITERNRVQDVLGKSEKRFRSLVTATSQIVWTTDPKGEVVDDIPTWCAFTGQSEQEAKGWGWSEALHPEDRQRTAEIWNQAVQSQTFYDTEYRVRRYDGEYRHFIVRGVPVLEKDGSIREWVGTCRDITERKQAEEKRLKSQAMLQAIFNGISDPLLMLDNDFRLKMLNDAARSYFQIESGEEATGRTCQELARGKCAPCEICVLKSALSEGQEITIERRGLFDPELFELVALYPAEEIDSGFSGAIIRISDVTEKANMEKHLTRADRLSSLGLLAGGIAHEIRNPLAGISLFVDLLRDVENFNQSARELDILEEIKNNIKKIDGIIKRILGFAKPAHTSLRNLKLTPLVKDALQLWGSKMRKKRIQLRLFLPEDLSDIFGDSIEIHQLLNNLVQNAIEAMQEGGSLNITARNAVFSCDKKRPAVIIEVQDSGSGIPLDQQQNIFNPFFTTKPTGTGLGLAISHRIVGRHRGIISFESVPDVGTTFTVELPSAPTC